jgi:hypothetical protein
MRGFIPHQIKRPGVSVERKSILQRQLQNSKRFHPRESGGPGVIENMDSRFRGNDNLGLLQLALHTRIFIFEPKYIQ